MCPWPEQGELCPIPSLPSPIGRAILRRRNAEGSRSCWSSGVPMAQREPGRALQPLEMLEWEKAAMCWGEGLVACWAWLGWHWHCHPGGAAGAPRLGSPKAPPGPGVRGLRVLSWSLLPWQGAPLAWHLSKPQGCGMLWQGGWTDAEVSGSCQGQVSHP